MRASERLKSILESVEETDDTLNAADGTPDVFDAEAGCALDRDLTRKEGS